MQVKLLRVLESGELERVGGQAPIAVDIRIIAATHQDLGCRMAEGSFREDLFFRLAGYEIHLPVLRERVEDIPLLACHYLPHLAREAGKPVASISAEAMRVLEVHTWPGNVRELKHALQYAIAHTHGAVLLPESLPARVRAPEPPESLKAHIRAQVHALLAGGKPRLIPALRALYEPAAIELALQVSNGNQHDAARILGIARNTLRSLLRRYGIDPGRTMNRPPGV